MVSIIFSCFIQLLATTLASMARAVKTIVPKKQQCHKKCVVSCELWFAGPWLRFCWQA